MLPPPTVWNCGLCSPITEIVGPCIAARAADDLLTSLICIGVNGVNELPKDEERLGE